MLTPPLRRLVVVLLSLVAMTLACARAEISIAPVTPDYATRQPPTATRTPLPPTATEIVPTAMPEPPTATQEVSKELPTEAGAAYPGPATETPALPAETPLPPPTETPVIPPTEPPPSLPTETPVPPPTETPLPPPTEAPPPTIPPQVIQPVGIPAGASFTQDFIVTPEGGEILGDPVYLRDKNTYTWAALEGGHTAWRFDLGAAMNMAGVKLYPQKPRTGDATTLLAIEVSNDGATWQAVFLGTGDCGEPACDILPQMKYVEIGFNPVSARYLRLRSGPNRFGFAEVAIAILP